MVITCDEPPPTPGLPPTVAAALESAVARFGGREALVDGDVRLTYTELFAAVDEAARGLIATGIAPGDRVAVWAPNTWEWVVAASAVHRIGAVVVTVNTRFKGDEAAYILRTARARLLFTVNGFLDTDYVGMLRSADEPPALDEIVVLRGDNPEGAISWSELRARASAVDETSVAARAAAIGADDTSDLLFTSGTTGRPKGAMLTHGASVRAYDSWSTVVGLREGDRYLIVNPFFHTFGLKAGILACMLKGATIVPHAVFDVASVMRRIDEERITMFPGPPAIYQTMLDHPERGGHDLSSLRLAVTGAATVPVEMIRRMREELTFRTIVTGYGLTESTGIATMCRHDDDPELISRTSGRPIPGVEMRLVDETGRDVATGEAGEVIVRGYNVMKGYFDDPVATAEAIDPDGWLHTGDVGVVDGAGNLTITDRKKDMFITGGFNVYPAEIENVLLAHPAVSQAAVVGVEDGRLGEVCAAFVVLRPGAAFEPDELVAWSRTRMANYKVPRHVRVVDALPLNASGKVLKYRLREEAAR